MRKTRGCWRWTGRVDRATGYGRLGRNLWAHRVAYELFVGPIPAGMTVEHLCHTRTSCAGGASCAHRSCVRPDHLALLTPAENKRAGGGRRTHCPQGHRYTPSNTYAYWRGASIVKKCRTCTLARDRAKRRAAGKPERRARAR